MVINIVDISGKPVDLIAETISVLSGEIHILSGRIDIQSGVHVMAQSGVYVVTQSGVGVMVQSGLHMASGGQVLGRVIQTDGETDVGLVDLRGKETTVLLDKIFKELRKINFQLNLITDNEIKNTDIEA